MIDTINTQAIADVKKQQVIWNSVIDESSKVTQMKPTTVAKAPKAEEAPAQKAFVKEPFRHVYSDDDNAAVSKSS